MSAERRRCGHCHFFEVTDGQAGGTCRRYPPRMVTPASASWARVRDDDWCGEYLGIGVPDVRRVMLEPMGGSSASNVGAVAEPEPPAPELPHDTEFEGDEGDQGDDEPDEAPGTNPERKPKKKKKGKR